MISRLIPISMLMFPLKMVGCLVGLLIRVVGPLTFIYLIRRVACLLGRLRLRLCGLRCGLRRCRLVRKRLPWVVVGTLGCVVGRGMRFGVRRWVVRTCPLGLVLIILPLIIPRMPRCRPCIRRLCRMMWLLMTKRAYLCLGLCRIPLTIILLLLGRWLPLLLTLLVRLLGGGTSRVRVSLRVRCGR